jgi:hypothetical protein
MKSKSSRRKAHKISSRMAPPTLMLATREDEMSPDELAQLTPPAPRANKKDLCGLYFKIVFALPEDFAIYCSRCFRTVSHDATLFEGCLERVFRHGPHRLKRRELYYLLSDHAAMAIVRGFHRVALWLSEYSALHPPDTIGAAEERAAFFAAIARTINRFSQSTKSRRGD